MTDFTENVIGRPCVEIPLGQPLRLEEKQSHTRGIVLSPSSTDPSQAELNI